MKEIINNMKRIIILIIALILINPAFAASGVGIKYSFEHADAIQNDITCLKYGVYNPFDDDITATILAEGDFAEYQFRPKEVDLPANTRSADAKDIDLCFKIPKIVDDCDSPVKLSGLAVATTTDKPEFAGSGSRAKIAVSAPLNLSVICGTPLGMSFLNSIEPNILLGVAIGGGVILLIVLVVFIFKRKRKKDIQPELKSNPKDEYMNKYSDLMVLHKKISANIASPEEVEKYKSLRSELEDLRNKL